MRICHINPIPILELVLVSEESLGEGRYEQTYKLTSGNGQLNSQGRVLELFRMTGLAPREASPFTAFTWETQRVTVPAVGVADSGEIVDERPINPITGLPYAPVVMTYIVVRFSTEISRG